MLQHHKYAIAKEKLWYYFWHWATVVLGQGTLENAGAECWKQAAFTESI